MLHLVQRGGDWAGPQPAQALLVVPNVTAHPSTASVRTSMWHHNFAFRVERVNIIDYTALTYHRALDDDYGDHVR